MRPRDDIRGLRQPGPRRRRDDPRHHRRGLPRLQRQQRPAVRPDLRAQGQRPQRRPARRGQRGPRGRAPHRHGHRDPARSCARTARRAPSCCCKLDDEAGPVPADSTIRIRPRSALGLKYVELERGKSRGHARRGRDDHRRRRRRSRPSCSSSSTSSTRRRATTSPTTSTSSAARFAGRGAVAQPRPSSRCRASCSAVPPVMLRARRPATRGSARSSPSSRTPPASARRSRRRWPTASAPAPTPSRRSPRDPGALQETIAESPPTLAVGTTRAAQHAAVPALAGQRLRRPAPRRRRAAPLGAADRAPRCSRASSRCARRPRSTAASTGPSTP